MYLAGTELEISHMLTSCIAYSRLCMTNTHRSLSIMVSPRRTETGLGHTVGAGIWKGMMATRTYPFVSQLRSQGREEGREEGRRETLVAAVLKVLDRRGIAVDDDSRERIETCDDVAVLDAWLDRAFAVAKASDLFSSEQES